MQANYTYLDCYIMENEEKIYSYDSFKELVGYNGMEEVVEYVKGITDKELYKDYTEEEYIYEYVWDYAQCALIDRRTADLIILSEMLFRLERNS